MIYTIKKGNHYSFPRFPKFYYNKTNLKAKFKLLEGCWFRKETPDDEAINKLFGFSRGFHHKNSVRCGWTPSEEPGKVKLFAYLYSDGKRYSELFITVEIGIEYVIEMNLSNDVITFILWNDYCQSISMSVTYPIPKTKWGYRLMSYFGGNGTAKVDTKIDLTFL